MGWEEINSLKILYAKQTDRGKDHVEVSYMGQREESKGLRRLRKKVVGQMPKLMKISQRKRRFVISNQGHSQMSEGYHVISVLDSG